MNPSEIYKLCGPLSVVITGLAIAFMVYKWRGDKGISISHNAAANRHSYLMMLVVQSVTLPMLFLFWSKWLAPTLELPTFFSICASLVCLGLLIAAWIPATKGWQDQTHRLAAYGAGALVIPMLLMLYLSPRISSTSKCVVVIVFAYELMVVGIFATPKSGGTWRLYLQAGYIFFFAFATLAVAYI